MATSKETKSDECEEISNKFNDLLKEDGVEKDSNANVVSERRGTGRCKWFNVLKGFGFLVSDDGGHEVFVHQSVIQMGGFRSLAQDELVEFEYKQSDKGFEATKVCGPGLSACQGSDFKPKPKKRFRKFRCYNCGEFANHLAKDCAQGMQPKRCHFCKEGDHLVANCPAKMKPNEKSENSNKTVSEETTENENENENESWI